MGSGQYVMEAVRNAETWMNNRNKKLKTRAPTVMPFTYKPELDTTRLLDDEDTNSYQQHIGVLRWAVELGRIDICTEVSMMASYCMHQGQDTWMQ